MFHCTIFLSRDSFAAGNFAAGCFTAQFFCPATVLLQEISQWDVSLHDFSAARQFFRHQFFYLAELRSEHNSHWGTFFYFAELRSERNGNFFLLSRITIDSFAAGNFAVGCFTAQFFCPATVLLQEISQWDVSLHDFSAARQFCCG